MRDVMEKIGQEMRSKYHWVDKEIPIYLYMGNAGGHVTDVTVNWYVKLLKETYNIIVIHQIPRSPETNMLDLGAWMAIQSIVEKMHLGHVKDNYCLARSAELAWDSLSSDKLTNIFNQWKLGMNLIIEDKGGNDKVQDKRSKIFDAEFKMIVKFVRTFVIS
eukprot:11208239-Ditylum_brightwellii.AAC.1